MIRKLRFDINLSQRDCEFYAFFIPFAIASVFHWIFSEKGIQLILIGQNSWDSYAEGILQALFSGVFFGFLGIFLLAIAQFLMKVGKFFNKKYSSATIRIFVICTCVILGVISSLLSSTPCVSSVHFTVFCRETKFDSQKWKTDESLRYGMLKNLKKEYNLVGLSKAEIIKLLGKPNKQFESSSRSIFYYNLKKGHNHFFEAKMKVHFDNGKVKGTDFYFDS